MHSYQLYLHIMGNTVPDNYKKKRKKKIIHSYSEIWRALPPIRTHVLVDKNYLLLVFSTLWKTLLPIMLRTRRAHETEGAAERTGRFAFGPGRSVGPHATLLCFSRCCFCHFDSITVLIMGGTAPDNYTK